MWNHQRIYNTMLLSNCLLNLDLIYEKCPSNIHEPSKTNMLVTPQNVMSQILPQCTFLYPVFPLLVSYTHFPNGFGTMTSPSTHFNGQRKCHLCQSSLAIYGLFSEKSFNSSSNFFYKPNITILSDKVRSGQTILFFLTEKLYTPNGFWTYDFILHSHLWEKVPFETKLIGAISCQNDERSNRPDRLISSPS